MKRLVIFSRNAFLGSSVAILLFSVAAPAQDTASRGASATRTELSASLVLYEALRNSPAYGERTRANAAARAAAIRARLERGDFQPGDRFQILVEGSTRVNDTVTVLSGPAATIPGFGELSLDGVLRSELEDHVQRHIVASVLDARVAVRVLVRIAVFGAVTTPGYQSVPLETRLDELLSGAGGPVADADPASMSVRRVDETLIEGDRVLAAIADGATVASLDLREGDYLTVHPRRPPFDRAMALQLFTVLAGPLITIMLVR